MNGSWSVGIGITNKCNLSCPHCYSRGVKDMFLPLSDLETLIESLDIHSINLGTGESFMHPNFTRIIEAIAHKGIKLSLTTNGYTVDQITDAQLRIFNDIDFSLDFPNAEEHDRFRKGSATSSVERGIQRCKDLGVECSIATAMMNINYNIMDELYLRAKERGVNLRVNIYKPVHTRDYCLSYDQFWEGVARLFKYSKIVACSEPIVNAALKHKVLNGGSPCGKNSIRVKPDGFIVPCVYLHDSTTNITDFINSGNRHEILQDSFANETIVPKLCKDCALYEYCQGGCASRRIYNCGLDKEDEFCFVARNDFPELDYQWGKSKDLVHSNYLCTIIVE